MMRNEVEDKLFISGKASSDSMKTCYPLCGYTRSLYRRALERSMRSSSGGGSVDPCYYFIDIYNMLVFFVHTVAEKVGG